MLGDKIFDLETRDDRLAQLERKMIAKVDENSTTSEIIEIYQEILEVQKIKSNKHVFSISTSTNNKFPSMIWIISLTVIIASLISFAAYTPCQHSKSRICQTTGLLRNYILSAFFEP